MTDQFLLTICCTDTVRVVAVLLATLLVGLTLCIALAYALDGMMDAPEDRATAIGGVCACCTCAAGVGVVAAFL